MSANITLPPQEYFLSVQHIHVDTTITDTILRKGTRGSFRQWDKNDYDLAVTRLQMPHTDGGFGLSTNTITQTSTKGAMVSRFLGLVGSLPLHERDPSDTLLLPPLKYLYKSIEHIQEPQPGGSRPALPPSLFDKH